MRQREPSGFNVRFKVIARMEKPGPIHGSPAGAMLALTGGWRRLAANQGIRGDFLGVAGVAAERMRFSRHFDRKRVISGLVSLVDDPFGIIGAAFGIPPWPCLLP
jgi:hypothetical protein